MLSGFLLQRCKPLWHGGAGTKVWKACQSQGKAGRAKVAESWAYVSLTPGLAPCNNPCAVCQGRKKVLKGKEAVSFCLQIYANWIFNPNFAIMIGGWFNFNIHKNVFAMAWRGKVRSRGGASELKPSGSLTQLFQLAASPNYPKWQPQPHNCCALKQSFRGKKNSGRQSHMESFCASTKSAE